MYLGYVKAGKLAETDQLYKSKLEALKVQKIFSDYKYETVILKELLGYVRQGDIIVVEDILDLSTSAGGFIELARKLFRQGVFVVCKDQQIDTSLAIWGNIFELLEVFESDTPQGTRGRPIRMNEDIEGYYKQVKSGKITVDEACEKLGIGRSTFYRHLRKIVEMPHREPKVSHPELFEQCEEQVQLGQMKVTEACKKMNIAISTYYVLRKKCQEKKDSSIASTISTAKKA